MASFNELFVDFQTTISSALIGAFSGGAINYVGRKANDALKVSSRQDVPGLIVQLGVDSVVAAGGYILVDRFFPATTQNAYFTFIFFLSQSSLNSSALKLASAVEKQILP